MTANATLSPTELDRDKYRAAYSKELADDDVRGIDVIGRRIGQLENVDTNRRAVTELPQVRQYFRDTRNRKLDAAVLKATNAYGAYQQETQKLLGPRRQAEGLLGADVAKAKAAVQQFKNQELRREYLEQNKLVVGAVELVEAKG